MTDQVFLHRQGLEIDWGDYDADDGEELKVMNLLPTYPLAALPLVHHQSHLAEGSNVEHHYPSDYVFHLYMWVCIIDWTLMNSKHIMYICSD